jgi:hypothetical protein
MHGHVFLAPGDLTQLAADAIAFSASNTLNRAGNLCSSFEANIPGFAGWYRDLRKSQSLPVPVGSTFWMPLDQQRKPDGVVVVVSTGRDDVADKAGASVRAAVDTAVARLRESGRTGRLLIGLPAFRVGMGGDHRQRLQSARAQVQAARDALQRHADVDVVFLTYTMTLYRIFLEARRAVLGPAPAPRHPELDRALDHRACVLFVGAGLSSGAGLPSWNELIDRLRGDLGIASAAKIDHLDLAQWYREQFGNDRLAEVLRSIYGTNGTPTLGHYLLLALPVRHVITTNYDHLIEHALTALKRHPVPVVSQEDVACTGVGGAVYVVKIHGDAEHPADIVLTRDDYHAFFEKRPAMALLLEGLLLNQTFFFVGYSLRDPNFRQVFSRVARMLKQSRRPAFATSFEARGDTAEYLIRQWQKQQLQLLPIPGETAEEQAQEFLRFLDALAERVTMLAPPLALAADVPASPRLSQLRTMLEAAGDELDRLCQERLDEQELHFLARLLDFLTEHGWRPARDRSRPLPKLYEELAGKTSDPEQRRRLLVAALGNAEAFADVERIRRLLEER